MLREAARSSAPVLVLPLMAGALAGCGQAEPAPNVVAAPPEQPKAPLSPIEAAQEKVRERVGASQVRFADARTFDSQGATIVCGRFAANGNAEQRFIAVGEQDLFIESQMAPGEMEQAVTETCKGERAR